ncbi:MAG: adenylyltransferase/cytidyltransferase family protein [Lachnospiraceae bacterium]|nr:adenylyltransferase/cytidyltransferase family protein [Lachnospiraceae bacterium]
MGAEKIVTKEQFKNIRKELKNQGKTIVLCHGVFDLLHLGHIEHFIDAKKHGDVLVVSITAAEYVNKGPGRPYFNDDQRLEFLSNLEIVDYCLLSESVTVHDIVECVQPDVYAKGKEYEKESNDISENIGSEVEIVHRYGGEVYYTEGEVHSSSKLLNRFFAALPEKALQSSIEMKERYGSKLISDIRKAIDGFRDIKILVVGDVILDEYVFCNVQGVTMKDASLSVFYDNEERYAGGALAIARHLAGFSNHVALCSMTGTEEGTRSFIRNNMGNISLEILEDSEFTTPVKRRYLKANMQRQEFDKLFSVNRLMKRGERKRFNYHAFHERLKRIIGGYDMVVVGDFGHGLLDEEAIRILESKSKFLAINCQSNSANMGTNIITKYKRADVFVVDERELRLAFGQALQRREELLAKLTDRMGSKYSWVTVGAEGAYGIKESETTLQPALTLSVKDTVGAGDAFYSLASMCAFSGVAIEPATLIANAAGALKTGVVGNKESVQKIDLLKFINTVLNV